VCVWFDDEGGFGGYSATRCLAHLSRMMRRWRPGLPLANWHNTANLNRPCLSFPAATPSYACPAGELWAPSRLLLVKPSPFFAHHTAGISITPLLPEPHSRARNPSKLSAQHPPSTTGMTSDEQRGRGDAHVPASELFRVVLR